MRYVKRFFSIVAIGTLMLFIGAVIVFGLGWLVWLLGSEQLIASNINLSDWWEASKMLYALVMMPAIFLGLFSLLSLRQQQNLKDGAYAMLHVADWLAKGALLVIGTYIAIDALNL